MRRHILAVNASHRHDVPYRNNIVFLNTLQKRIVSRVALWCSIGKNRRRDNRNNKQYHKHILHLQPRCSLLEPGFPDSKRLGLLIRFWRRTMDASPTIIIPVTGQAFKPVSIGFPEHFVLASAVVVARRCAFDVSSRGRIRSSV